ncbi:MAG: hypothetical protein RL226_305, partial [Bacteroidota bacterium]
VQCFMRLFNAEHDVLLVAGKGNNGGDAFAMALLLAEQGYRCSVFAPYRACSADATYYQSLASKHARISYTETFPDERFDVIIDGVLGSGLKGIPDHAASELIEWLNNRKVPVFAIDVPSGLPCHGYPHGSAVKASVTATIQTLKRSFLLAENEGFIGQVEVVDIGLDAGFRDREPSDWLLLQAEDIVEVAAPRSKFSHKGRHGHLALVAGSEGMYGAAILSARAAMRSGVALLTVYTTEHGAPVIHAALPEVMVDARGILEPINFPNSRGFDAVAVGPGLGKSATTAQALLEWLEVAVEPVVLDADALNILANHPSALKAIPENSILTPHPGEFDRLFGKHLSELTRIQTATEKATEHNLIIVLKGAFTRVAMPTGEVWFNSTGNPGMATAGSGDVLTGIIGSLLAQGHSPVLAALAGVWIHGRAGDLAANQRGEVSLMAHDIIDMLPQVFMQLGKLK